MAKAGGAQGVGICAAAPYVLRTHLVGSPKRRTLCTLRPAQAAAVAGDGQPGLLRRLYPAHTAQEAHEQPARQAHLGGGQGALDPAGQQVPLRLGGECVERAEYQAGRLGWGGSTVCVAVAPWGSRLSSLGPSAEPLLSRSVQSCTSLSAIILMLRLRAHRLATRALPVPACGGSLQTGTFGAKRRALAGHIIETFGG